MEGERREALSDYRIAACRDEGETHCLWSHRSLSTRDIKDFTAATTFLEPLCSGPSSSPSLRSAIARIHLQAGNIATAAHHISIVDADPNAEVKLKNMNAVLLAAADGNWTAVAARAQVLLETDSDNVVVCNRNLLDGEQRTHDCKGHQ